IATDIARYDIGSSAEFTQGAGAAALVVSANPRLLELEPTTGVFASNVYDFWRPLDRREAVVDGKFSLDCYLAALDGALDDYRRARNQTANAPLGADQQSLLLRFAALLYHTPFPKMAYKAHLRLVERECARRPRGAADALALAERSFATLVAPG